MMSKKLLMLAIPAALALSACGWDDDDDTPASSATASTTFAVMSSAFKNGGVIPMEYAAASETQPGNRIPLSIQNLPKGTEQLTVVMDDETSPCKPAEGACIHWGIYGLQPTQTEISENNPPPETAELKPYFGPMPPRGTTHTYTITVYALKNASVVTYPTSTTDRAEYTRAWFEKHNANNIIQKADLVGKFTSQQ